MVFTRKNGDFHGFMLVFRGVTVFQIINLESGSPPPFTNDGLDPTQQLFRLGRPQSFLQEFLLFPVETPGGGSKKSRSEG